MSPAPPRCRCRRASCAREGLVKPGALPQSVQQLLLCWAQSQDTDPCPPHHPGGHSHAPTPQGWAELQWQTTGAPRSAQTPFPQELLRGPVRAMMVFQWKAGASLSLTAYDKYGARCQGKIYPFLSFYQLSNMFDFSQALSVAGI